MISSEHDLRPGGGVLGKVLAVIVIGVLSLGGYIVFRLATENHTAVACDHLAELAKTDPATPEAVESLVRYVTTHVERITLKDREAISVSGSGMYERCTNALETLDRALSHRPFTQIRDCLAEAPSAKAAGKCF